MGIVGGKFGFDEIKKRINKSAMTSSAPSDLKVGRLLSYIGEELCNHARTITKGHSSGGYDDQTGNLRSSIGYRIYKDGKPWKDGGFQNVTVTNQKGETVKGNGEADAKVALDKYGLAYDIPMNGWTLVIVAGMSYATYVEAKGYNVLHLTNIEMQKEIEQLRKDLGI